MNEIAKACDLASGFSDIVIILTRPRETHKFDGSFTEFVKGCKTLQAVDELIRFATKGARSIHTVTVVDMFSFQPDENDTPIDERCHSILAQILKAKKPRVVLCCHSSESYNNETLKCLETIKDYGLHRKMAEFAKGYKTDILQSFHPSIAMSNSDCRPEFRALLIHHFVAAFGVLNDKVGFEIPDSVEEIRKLCLLKGLRVKSQLPNLDNWEAARHISRVLKDRYSLINSKLVFLVDIREHVKQSQKMGYFDEMYAWLERLFGQTSTFGTLGIAIVITFLWNKLDCVSANAEQMKQWLLIRGNEQEDWFPSPGHHVHNTLRSTKPRSMEDLMSNMNITHTNDESLREAMVINNELALLTSALLEPSVSGETPFTAVKDKIYHYLRQSTSRDIKVTIKIGALTKHCELLADMLVVADSKDERERDLEDLLAHVKQLHTIFTALSV